MLLAPEPQVGTAVLVRDATTRQVTATIDVVPELRPAQDATLSIAGESAPVEAHPTQTPTLTFELGDVPPGPQPVRLTVDGVESLLIDYEAEPP